MEHVPGLAVRFGAVNAAQHQFGPFHFLTLDRKACALKGGNGHVGEGRDHRAVDRIHNDDRRAVIRCGGQHFAGFVYIPFGEGAVRDRLGEFGAARINRRANPPILGNPDGGFHVVGLIHRGDRGQAHINIVERGNLVVEDAHADAADGICQNHANALDAFEFGGVLGGRRLEILHLVVDQGLHGLRLIRVAHPFNTFEERGFRARRQRGRFFARHIVVIAHIDHAFAGNPFILGKFERPGPGRIGDRHSGIGFGDPRGHHKGHVCRHLRKRGFHRGVGRFEGDREGIVSGRLDGVDLREQDLPHAIARAPTAQRCHAVTRGHRRAVMPFHARTQRKVPFKPVLGHRPSVNHLGLRRE